MGEKTPRSGYFDVLKRWQWNYYGAGREPKGRSGEGVTSLPRRTCGFLDLTVRETKTLAQW